jgi:ubiquinone/menaquinone biosynthesis C-methylase UbiE
MLLNRFETLVMNNPVRSAIQRHAEAARLLAMGGPMRGGRALEVGCGQGVGVELILDVFGAGSVDAMDLDPRMIALARSRSARRGDRVHLAVGEVTAIDAPDATYDAVFDFGILHHVPPWRDALAELHRVLRPGGRLYAEEVLDRFIRHPVWRRLLDHPQTDRFDHRGFVTGLEAAGFRLVADQNLGTWFGWYVADKPAA